ncbi:patatin-like phospholipase family protein [Pseudoflavitalea sp. X16]|uniref:patatin-like phospholipase family protein n=1 Tax=Paraflavitalea devenefica TaxID=2716334 RepID=UPI0014218061|nr:patatin-like phospholipase family protein [Paraflavitalea devenefica]NII24664.1 patatin-like phospholipase family protein [Paraflavitalea devenefica]
MKIFLRGLYHSFPIQLFLLHFKKYQVLLIFWFVLFSTVNGTFMKSFGADSLYLAPEYLGKVNALSAAFVGVSIGIFIMSWNITTFILFSRHFRFLATTSNPFLKYCINNGIIPLLFLLFYFSKATRFAGIKELMNTGEIALLVAGFIGGLILIISISFFYFFRADKTIIRRLTPVISNPQLFKAQFRKGDDRLTQSRLVKVEWYLNSLFTLKKVRDVSHYSREFVETIFSRHHFAAVLSIFVAFIFLIGMGFWLDHPLFQLPAASGITLFFAILIAVSGAFSYFMQSWSIPVLVLLFFVLNLLYRYNIIDPSNKAYGLSYDNKEHRPAYTRENLLALSSPEKTTQDKENMIRILERWKARQENKKPVMFIINTSGGGNRSATFTMNVLQYLDSLSDGELMRRTAFITGASGGMLGAAYFRELSREREKGKQLRLQDDRYVDDISGDLLNALFTSFVARDLASPAQKFNVNGYEYVKDRGYAFEQKLNENTHGLLNKQLRHLYDDEASARTPLMLFSSVITQDSRKMLISTQPMSFLMKPVYDTNKLSEIEPDAVDYQSMFAGQNPMNLRLLTALRMNATFPYVLPNVWLPTDPVIDVMDAGLRDNYGLETTIRFLQVFRHWIRENTSGVVLLQIRDRKIAGWEPYESDNITEIATKPMLLLQHNWYKMQEYSQADLLCLSQEIFGQQFYKLSFTYLPKKEDARAALNFHLTRSEKLDINEALFSTNNQQSFQFFKELLKPRTNPPAK